MNKNIKLAVAGAVLALSATAANAGIVIPAGDWTLDVSGNVNAYSVWNKSDNSATISSTGITATTGVNTQNMLTNGLLPNFLGFTGTTRQNDLDVSFTISLQPGSAHNSALGVGADGGINNRQAFITFGDKSWGSVKVGKDLGIFASDAILNDMTLLGVGATAGSSAGNTTLGRIGYGYIYADWKPMIAYTTPNFNGFQATVGISQNFKSINQVGTSTSISSSLVNASPAYEGKVSYSFAANDVTGKIWASGIAQRTGSIVGYTNTEDPIAYAGDIGANVNVAGFGVTGYYYNGTAIGHQGQGWDGYGISSGTTLKGRDSDGGYVQVTYVLPTKTKLGVSWGESNLDKADGESFNTLLKSNEMWTAGVYHPLTKHLNLVAEYSHATSENQVGAENKNNIGSLGAILFF